MEETSEYEKKANDFLTKHNIKFSARFKGDKCPLFCDGTCKHGERYLITFKRPSKSFSLSFWNSVNDMQEGKKPTAYDVLACIQKNDVGTFEDFCGDFGYSEDSIKASKTYKAVLVEWQKASKFFTPEELEEAQEIQ